jgi:Uma2 family endonuclease
MSPSFNHAYIGANMVLLFGKLNIYTILIEISIEIQGKEYVPDVALYSKRKMQRSEDIIRMTEMPLLAIEVLSPKQSTQDVIDKIKVYFENGIKSCWFINPTIHTVTVYKSFKDFTTYVENTELQDDSLGIKMNVSEIFD